MESKSLFFLCLVACFYHIEANDEGDLQQLMHLLMKPRLPERFKEPHHLQKGVHSRVTNFNYNNCGKSTDPIYVNSLKLGPDPLKLPGNITVSVQAKLTKDLKAPIKLDLTIKKKVLIWVEVPCIDDVGSCTYDDACALLSQITCPPEFKKYGIPCTCPIKAGSYNLPTTSVEVPKIPDVPSFLTDGDYKLTAKMSSGGTELGCLELEVSLAKIN